MRANEMLFVALCAGLLVPFAAMAQQGGMVVSPPAIQAIETHLQQNRTREQREMMEYKNTAPVPTRQSTYSAGAMRKPVAAKPKEAPSTIQDLDEQALFDRPGAVRRDSKLHRSTIK